MTTQQQDPPRPRLKEDQSSDEPDGLGEALEAALSGRKVNPIADAFAVALTTQARQEGATTEPLALNSSELEQALLARLDATTKNTL